MKEIRDKLNQLLFRLPRGIVITSSWLHEKGVSYRMLHHHSSSENSVLENIGAGAYVISGQRENLQVAGGLFSLATQLKLKFHLGAVSALVNGHSSRHFVTFQESPLEIFLDENRKFPKWFDGNFKDKYRLFQTRFLNTDIGLQNANFQGFDLRVSCVERAVLETIFQNSLSIREIAQILEMLTNLRPNILQDLLESCSSIRVKRVFLYLAEKQKHSWFDFLDLSRINLGKGKRVISNSGKLNKKYGIVIEDLDEI